MEKERKEIDIWQLLTHLWRNKKQLFIYCAIGAAAGIVVAFSIPKEYTCTVVVTPEKSTSSAGSLAGMGGLASMMGVNVGGGSNGINENIYPDILKSSPFIAEFENIELSYKGQQMTLFDYLTKEQKYPWWKAITGFPSTVMGWFSPSSEEPKQGGVRAKDIARPSNGQYYYESSFTQRVVLKQDKKTNIIEVSIKMQDPEIAAIIADSIIYNIDKYIVNYQTSKLATDLNQTKKTLEEAKQAFYKADSLYAAAQDRNQNLIRNSATIKINRLKDERNISYSVYEQLANKVEALKIKLQQETPVMTVIQPARVPLQPVSPNKITIIIGFLVLGGFVAAGKIIYKYLFKGDDSNSQKATQCLQN